MSKKYFNKLSPKWEKKLKAIGDKVRYNKKKLEKYSDIVEVLQNEWADDWILNMTRKYIKYHNRDLVAEIELDAQAESFKDSFAPFSSEFDDYVYDEVKRDPRFKDPVGMTESYCLSEVLGEISCILLEEQGDQFWVNRLNTRLKTMKKLEKMKDERGLYVIK